MYSNPPASPVIRLLFISYMYTGIYFASLILIRDIFQTIANISDVFFAVKSFCGESSIDPLILILLLPPPFGPFPFFSILFFAPWSSSVLAQSWG